MLSFRFVSRTGDGEIEEECRSYIQFRFGPNGAAMLLNNPLHRRQTYPCAVKLFLAVQTLKHPEQLVGVFHVKPHSVVPDKDGGRVVTIHLSHFDHGWL